MKSLFPLCVRSLLFVSAPLCSTALFAQQATPLPGTEAFLKSMQQHAAYLLPKECGKELEAAAQDFEEGKQAEASSKLLNLLDKSTETITIDFSQGAPNSSLLDFHPIEPISGAVLIKFILSEKTSGFTTASKDLSTVLETERSFKVPVYDHGTTWLLLDLDHLPAGKQAFHLAFLPQGAKEPTHYHGIFLDTPSPGKLRLSLHDENGLETPALIRLEPVKTGIPCMPSNAVDFRDISSDISGTAPAGPEKSFAWYTPGPNRGNYWVVPGGCSMGLEPGDWRVVGIKGNEFYPFDETFKIASGETTQLTIDLKRWVNMSQMGWYSGDDHVHAQMMSDHDAQRLLTFSQATDVNVANILCMGNEMRTWYEQRGFGPTSQYGWNKHYLVPGSEDPRYRLGHAIGLNTLTMVRDYENYMLNDLVADQIHLEGGLYGFAHVGFKAFNIIRDMTLLIPREKADFATIFQGMLNTDYYYDFLDLGYTVTASAGTDFSYGSTLGNSKVYTYIGKDEGFTIQKWFDALEQGKTFVTNGPVLTLMVDDALPGETLTFKKNKKVTLSATATGNPDTFKNAKLQLIQFGKVIAEGVSSDGGKIKLSHQVDVEYGSWIAARVDDQYGAAAHTTPVYIKRKGYRPWNYERVPELIEDRLATLTEIENELKSINDEITANKVWSMDAWRRTAARNTPKMMERIELVRALYMELNQQWEDEEEKR